MINDTRHKIFSFEVPPPPGVWDRIASALDESGSGLAFPVKLKELEAIPPAQSWNKIAAALDAAEQTNSVPKTILIPWLKYAAAAAIISFMTWGALSYFNRKNTSEKNTATIHSQKTVTPVPEQIDPARDNTNVAVTAEQRDAAALEESKKTFASIDISTLKRRTRLSQIQLEEPVELASVSERVNPARTYQELACNEIAQPSVRIPNDTNLATRYVLLMTPDGKLIRISRKWSSLLCCVSGEDSDPGCTDQVKQWRARIVGALSAPSSGNFMDILTLVNSLQEN